LANQARNLLFQDKLLKQEGSTLDITVFNGDVLLVGHVPSLALRDLAIRRLDNLSGYRRLFKFIMVRTTVQSTWNDVWITSKIRTCIIADSAIDPNLFKVITSDNIVYLMGDAPLSEGRRVIDIARHTNDVIRVVNLLKHFVLSV